MKITHILADGTKKADITGHVVKAEEATDFYKILETINNRLTNEKSIKEEA